MIVFGKVDASVAVDLYTSLACSDCKTFHEQVFGVLMRFALTARVSIFPVNTPFFALMNEPMVSADFFMTFSFVVRPPNAASCETKPFRADGLECKRNKRLRPARGTTRLAGLLFGCASSFETGSDRQVPFRSLSKVVSSSPLDAPFPSVSARRP
jgi:hypothetical protein